MSAKCVLLLAAVAVFFVACAHDAQASKACLNNEGQAVDWWFMYKLPKLSKHNNPSVAGGYGFAYHDSESNGAGLKIFERGLDDNSNAVALVHTLRQIATKSSEEAVHMFSFEAEDALNRTLATGDFGFLIYNDEPFSGASSDTYGHTKGVVGFDSADGFWLVHSTPRYPSNTGSEAFYFPENEVIYGQTFLCVSFDLSEIDSVGNQLLYNRPNVYSKLLPAKLASKLPNIKKVFDGEFISEGDSSTVSLTSAGNGKFVSFAKNKNWNQDLYITLVAPHYKTDFQVETWQRQGTLPSYCTPEYAYDILNVDEVTIEGTPFLETQDHSKWAASLKASPGVVCVGDINRMSTQRKRGGGTVCFQNSSLWKSLSASVSQREDCKK